MQAGGTFVWVGDMVGAWPNLYSSAVYITKNWYFRKMPDCFITYKFDSIIYCASSHSFWTRHCQWDGKHFIHFAQKENRQIIYYQIFLIYSVLWLRFGSTKELSWVEIIGCDSYKRKDSIENKPKEGISREREREKQTERSFVGSLA